MKSVVRFLLSSFLFLFLSTFATAVFDSVHDTDGNRVKRGHGYYILPSPGIGGGLVPNSRNGSCPFDVAQQSSETDLGHPVEFFSYDGHKSIRVLTDANFVFSGATICVQSTVWRLGATDEATGRTYVTTGGIVGRKGPQARSNWFRIEKFEDDGVYKLVFCPQPPVCRGCGKPRCGDLGLFAEDGKVWLGLGGSPFPVMFKKAY